MSNPFAHHFYGLGDITARRHQAHFGTGPAILAGLLFGEVSPAAPRACPAISHV